MFVKIENGVVIQKQPNEDVGFIEVPNSVVCGMLYDGQDFTSPPATEPIVNPNPDTDIQADIAASTDFASLKAALLGQGPSGTRVRGVR